MNRSITIATVTLALAGTAALVNAQVCQVRSSARAVAFCWGTGNSDVSMDTGWTAPGPPQAPIVAFDTNPDRGCSGRMEISSSAGYGVFQFTAGGSGQTTAEGMYLSARGRLQFQDTLTVSSSTLPVGTPVTLRYLVTIGGSALVADRGPVVNLLTTLGPCTTAMCSGFGTATQVCQTTVGAEIPWGGQFDVLLSADGLADAGPALSTIASAVDAVYRIEILTPGVTVTSCSGTNYTICHADFNHDGFVDPIDYNAFINAFESGDMAADVNGDGFLDPLDYNGYINAFEAGC